MGLEQYAPSERNTLSWRVRERIRAATARFIVNKLAPGMIAKAEARMAAAIAAGKPEEGYDFLIAPLGAPYLYRWRKWPRNPIMNVYLHMTVADDDNRALHDHPWLWNWTLMLRNAYFEIMPCRAKSYVGGDAVMSVRREAGDLVFRRGSAAHRLMLPADGKPAWSLFITGPRLRAWGFYCPGGWRPEQEYRDRKSNGAAIGAGCD